jgi:hypothetical protein
MKQKLTVIQSPPQQDPPDYAGIYMRILIQCLKLRNDSTDWTKHFVYLSMKGIPKIFEGGITTQVQASFPSENLLTDIWLFIGVIQKKMGLLTPDEFIKIFPVEKHYDGGQYGNKDYFSTMDELQKIGMDRPIGQHAESLLFDYQNPHVIEFNFFKMMVLDRLRAYQGQPSMAEEFMGERGIHPMRMMTDHDGKQFLYDPDKKTTYPVMKKYPRYLKLVN